MDGLFSLPTPFSTVMVAIKMTITFLQAFELLMNDQVPSVEALLNRLDPIPIAGKPQSAVLAPKGDANGITRSRLPIVIHLDL